MNLSDFDYNLSPELIAQEPTPRRDQSRLLVLNRKTGQIAHHTFSHLVDLLHKGDLLIMNNSRVFPARLIGVRAATGGRAEILLEQEMDDGSFEVIGRNLRVGEEIAFPHSELKTLVEKKSGKEAVVKFNLTGEKFWQEIERIGRMPLPPYIHSQQAEKIHRDRYQTVYAKNRGSVAAPTAGLHFTTELIEKIKAKGVEVREVTLHVGLGTFAPVEIADITKHKMHHERFSIEKEVIEAIIRAKAEHRRVIAVGTTTTRVFEHLAAVEPGILNSNIENLTSKNGSTDIFIYPGYKFKVIDGLITNFHLPKSTLLMLVSAFAGRDNIRTAYEEAIREKYRFFSYGDAMMIV